MIFENFSPAEFAIWITVCVVSTVVCRWRASVYMKLAKRSLYPTYFELWAHFFEFMFGFYLFGGYIAILYAYRSI